MVHKITVEHVILEMFGLVFPAAVTYALQRQIAFLPIMEGQNNEIILALIPSAVYLAARIVYGVLFWLGESFVPSTWRKSTSFCVVSRY